MNWKLPVGKPVSLKDFDPRNTDSIDKMSAEQEKPKLYEKLAGLQEVLYAQKEHAVLFILQGMDCSGKDGAMKHAFGAFHPQGFTQIGFKAPTEEELAHDFLWKAHRVVPGKGQIAAFNRSYYEEVLINRVHGRVSDKLAKVRFKQINHFEDMLTENGVTLVKIFLHISKEFQREKLMNRIEDPTKNWKFDPNDLAERKRWDDYQRCYEDIFENCSSKNAPWHLVPADRRWYRDYAVMRIALDALEKLSLRYPEPVPGLQKLLKELEKDR